MSRTIVAMATAPGRSALAMVRISGPGMEGIAKKLLTRVPAVAGKVTRTAILDIDGVTIDDVIAVRYKAPKSFTGEDMLEITSHGGAIAPTAIVAAAIHAGAATAEPGEFTRRAVLNGKVDLLQAEAIGDLIDARTSAAHRMALQQLDGGLSRRIGGLRKELLELEALLAYDIDFPEEDDGPIPRARIEETAVRIKGSLDALLATGTSVAQIRDGALVVLAGAPNAGKSSLFNALLGEARAIVTDTPGTTRDAIEAVLDVPGWPLRLVDTAGLRDTTEEIEQIGIETASRYVSKAAVVIHCTDARDGHAMSQALAAIPPSRIIDVRTKVDLVANSYEFGGDVHVSAVTGTGLSHLLREVEARLADSVGAPELEQPALTRARHTVAVREASDELDAFLVAWREDTLPAIVAATHVRHGVDVLSELIGVVQVDDVLDVVFRSFCVGK